MKKNLLGISMITMAGLYFLLSVVILILCTIIDLPISYGLMASIIILVLQFIISPWLTDISMKLFYKANFSYEVPEYLNNFIEEICKKYNMKKPRIGFIDDGSPNAFTYGHTKNDARIVITRGIFELLDEEEVISVIAHELGHATHYDMLFMTVAQLVPLVLYYIYEITIKADNKSNDDNNKIAIVGIIAFVLYIISEYIVLWLSRTREYYADEFSITETKNPNALASSLVKIGFGLITNKNKSDDKTKRRNVGIPGLFDSKSSKSLVVMTNNNADDKMTIKNAMKWEMWNPWAIVHEINSTHPLISKRLITISKYSKEYGQEPYIEFDLRKPESYFDDFLIELLIKFSPLVIAIAAVILIMIFGNDNIYILYSGIAGILFTCSLFIGFNRSHKKGYNKTTVAKLLEEVKVSSVTSVSCELVGEIIGRGDAGYIFNEDFMIRDETGIIYADYNTPLWILNKVFALFKNGKNAGKKVVIRGWYRRSPVPYVEIYDFIIDGKKHRTGTYTTSIVGLSILMVISLLVTIIGIL